MSGFKECSQRIARECSRRRAVVRPRGRRIRRALVSVVAAAWRSTSPIEGAMKEMEEGNKRTLQRDHTILKEFDDGTDPGLLALYYHKRDMAFDAFNAAEYTKQMENYYANDIKVKLVLPRKIGENKLSLVCLQNIQPEKDTLCDLAFQAIAAVCRPLHAGQTQMLCLQLTKRGESVRVMQMRLLLLTRMPAKRLAVAQEALQADQGVDRDAGERVRAAQAGACRLP